MTRESSTEKRTPSPEIWIWALGRNPMHLRSESICRADEVFASNTGRLPSMVTVVNGYHLRCDGDERGGWFMTRCSTRVKIQFSLSVPKPQCTHLITPENKRTTTRGSSIFYAIPRSPSNPASIPDAHT